MEYRFFRASDLARAIAYKDAEALKWKPFIVHHSRAQEIHEQRREAYSNERTQQFENMYFTRKTGNIYVTGKVDGFISNPDGTLSVLEVKTFTGQVTDELVKLAVVQIQIYAWLVRPRIQNLSRTHTIEFIDRDSGKIYWADVHESEDIEVKIWSTVYEYLDRQEVTGDGTQD